MPEETAPKRYPVIINKFHSPAPPWLEAFREACQGIGGYSMMTVEAKVTLDEFEQLTGHRDIKPHIASMVQHCEADFPLYASEALEKIEEIAESLSESTSENWVPRPEASLDLDGTCNMIEFLVETLDSDWKFDQDRLYQLEHPEERAKMLTFLDATKKESC